MDFYNLHNKSTRIKEEHQCPVTNYVVSRSSSLRLLNWLYF